MRQLVQVHAHMSSPAASPTTTPPAAFSLSTPSPFCFEIKKMEEQESDVDGQGKKDLKRMEEQESAGNDGFSKPRQEMSEARSAEGPYVNNFSNKLAIPPASVLKQLVAAYQMEIATIFTSAVFFSLILTIIFSAGTDGSPVRVGAAKVSNSFLLGGLALGPISDGLLKFTHLVSEPMSMDLDLGVILVLTAKRTRRPNMLNKFRRYRGGWDISDKLYWASIGFTGAAGFILALIWFLSLHLH